MLNELGILLTHFLCYAKNAFLVVQDKMGKISTNTFIEAFNLLDNHISTLHSSKWCMHHTILSTLVDDLKQAKTKQDCQTKHSAPINIHPAHHHYANMHHACYNITTLMADYLSGTMIFKRKSDKMMTSAN